MVKTSKRKILGHITAKCTTQVLRNALIFFLFRFFLWERAKKQKYPSIVSTFNNFMCVFVFHAFAAACYCFWRIFLKYSFCRDSPYLLCAFFRVFCCSPNERNIVTVTQTLFSNNYQSDGCYCYERMLISAWFFIDNVKKSLNFHF